MVPVWIWENTDQKKLCIQALFIHDYNEANMQRWNSFTTNFTLNTGLKLNVHNIFRRRPRRFLNVSCTFILRPVSAGWSIQRVSSFRDLYPFNDLCSHHIETSQLICSANQLTGFYMMGILVVNGSTSGLKTETKEKCNLLKKYKRNCGKRNKCS